MKRQDRNNKRYSFIVIILSSLFFVSAGFAGDLVPNTFSSGETLSASKMNDNFNSLEYYINEAVDFLTIQIRENGSAANYSTWTTSEVSIVSCLSNQLLVGGNCSSRHDSFNSSTTNYGFVAACEVTLTSVLGYSSIDFGFHDTLKFGPPITVQAICVSATEISGLTIISSETTADQEPALSDEDMTLMDEMEKRVSEYQKLAEERIAE